MLVFEEQVDPTHWRKPTYVGEQSAPESAVPPVNLKLQEIWLLLPALLCLFCWVRKQSREGLELQGEKQHQKKETYQRLARNFVITPSSSTQCSASQGCTAATCRCAYWIPKPYEVQDWTQRLRVFSGRLQLTPLLYLVFLETPTKGGCAAPHVM